jgi:hypothetical protein
MVLLKLDFEKAFDKVEHEVIVQVMKHKLSRKIDAVDSRDLNLGTSSVLLNGTPSKVFHYKRGVR